MNCGFVGCDAVWTGSWLPAFRVIRLLHQHHGRNIHHFSIMYSDCSVWELKMNVTGLSEM